MKISTWSHSTQRSLAASLHHRPLVFEILLNDEGTSLFNCVIQMILVLLGEVHPVHYLVCMLRRERMEKSLVGSNHHLTLINEGLIVPNRSTKLISRATVNLKITSEKLPYPAELSSILVLVAKDDMLREGSVPLFLLQGDWVRRHVELKGLGLIITECTEVDHLLVAGGLHV